MQIVIVSNSRGETTGRSTASGVVPRCKYCDALIKNIKFEAEKLPLSPVTTTSHYERYGSQRR